MDPTSAMSEAVCDIHICGSCRQEFTTVEEFIIHKGNCMRNRKLKDESEKQIIHHEHDLSSLTVGASTTPGNDLLVKSESRQNEVLVQTTKDGSEMIISAQSGGTSLQPASIIRPDLSTGTALVQVQTPHGMQVIGNIPVQLLQDLQQQQLRTNTIQWPIAPVGNPQLTELQTFQQMLQDQQIQQQQQQQQQQLQAVLSGSAAVSHPQDYVQPTLLPFLHMTLSESQQTPQISTTTAPTHLVPIGGHEVQTKTLEAFHLLSSEQEQQLVLQSLLNATASPAQHGDRPTTTIIDIQTPDNPNASTIIDVMQVPDETVKGGSKQHTGKSPRELPAKVTWKILSGSPIQDTLEKTAPKYHCTYPDCSYITQYAKNVDRHLLIHTGEKPFPCLECKSSFSRADKLKTHQRTHTGDKPFKCSHCDYKCSDNGSLKKHLRTHTNERPFKCQICSYASRSSSQLTVHLRTHTGDKPFMCPECNATFKIKSDLKRHCRLHTGEKPFGCPKCDFKTAIKSNLTAHDKTQHCAENLVNCNDCDFQTSSKRNFRNHVKGHNMPANKRLNCQQCDYSCFDQKLMLNHHSRHSNYRPYGCAYCPYKAKTRSCLGKHLSKRHDKELANHKTDSRKKRKILPYLGDSPGSKKAKRKLPSCLAKFLCNLCGTGFVREDSLRSHLRSHKEKDDYKALVQEAMQKQIDAKLGRLIETGVDISENGDATINSTQQDMQDSDSILPQRTLYSINQEHEYAAVVQHSSVTVGNTAIESQASASSNQVVESCTTTANTRHTNTTPIVAESHPVASSSHHQQGTTLTLHQQQQQLLPYIQNNHNMAVWDNMQNSAISTSISHQDPAPQQDSAAPTQQNSPAVHHRLVTSHSQSSNVASGSTSPQGNHGNQNGVPATMTDQTETPEQQVHSSQQQHVHYLADGTEVVVYENGSMTEDSGSGVQNDLRSAAHTTSGTAGSAIQVLSVDAASLPDDVGEVLKTLSLHKGACQVLQLPAQYSTGGDQKVELVDVLGPPSGRVPSPDDPTDAVSVQYYIESKEVAMNQATLENNNTEVLHVIQPLYLPPGDSSEPAAQKLLQGSRV